MLAVVLAAGRGTRLRPLTDARSKAMLPVAGQPMIGRVLGMLRSGGCDRFILVVHPDDTAMTAYVEQRPWADVVQIVHQYERQGMAHALACAAPAVREGGARGFVLAACDNLYPEGHVAALLGAYQAQRWDAALTLMHVRREVIPTLAVVAIRDGRVTQIVEKPQPDEAPSDLGVPALYVLSSRALDLLPRVPLSPRGELEFPDVLRLLIEDGGQVGGVLVTERMTLTCPRDLLALNRHYLRVEPTALAVAQDPTVVIVPPVRIEAGAVVGPGCHIGPEVYLEAGCAVGAEAVLRRAVVLRGAVVAPGTAVEDAVVG